MFRKEEVIAGEAWNFGEREEEWNIVFLFGCFLEKKRA
jgi:hypothetical protein